MKMWKKLLASVFTGVLLFGFSACNVFASAQAEQAYTYKVTVYAGKQGTFEGTDGLVLSNPNAVVTQTDEKIVVSGLNYGDEVAFTVQADVKLDTGSKYYVQGMRLGGRDNDTVAASAFIVRSDVDYVVAYGIKGNQVSYTVNYHDEYGNEMLPSETFYGNVGDKPVIACKYVDGYLPQASGLTKTLKENAAENVLTFIYKPVSGPVIEDVITTVTKEEYVDVVVGGTQIVDGETTGGGTTGGGETTGTGTTPGGTVLPDGNDNENAGTDAGNQDAAGNEGTENNDNTAGTDDDLIIDLDEEEVPLANIDEQINEQQDLTMLKYLGVIGVAVLALVGLLCVAFIRRKREGSKEEEA